MEKKKLVMFDQKYSTLHHFQLSVMGKLSILQKPYTFYLRLWTSYDIASILILNSVSITIQSNVQSGGKLVLQAVIFNLAQQPSL